jgi:molybdopterin synthase sulfur carrier subunit
MKIRVRLYGTLRQGLPADRQSEGIEVEIPEGATVRDLLVQLGIPESQGISVVIRGRVLAAEDVVQPGAPVEVFQAIGGG